MVADSPLDIDNVLGWNTPWTWQSLTINLPENTAQDQEYIAKLNLRISASTEDPIWSNYLLPEIPVYRDNYYHICMPRELSPTHKWLQIHHLILIMFLDKSSGSPKYCNESITALTKPSLCGLELNGWNTPWTWQSLTINLPENTAQDQEYIAKLIQSRPRRPLLIMKHNIHLYDFILTDISGRR
jgi:hypothetical protein